MPLIFMISIVGDGGIPPRFSPGMTPDQLEQWLLHEYGEAYKNDIGKVKGIRFVTHFGKSGSMIFSCVY